VSDALVVAAVPMQDHSPTISNAKSWRVHAVAQSCRQSATACYPKRTMTSGRR
jgi:hypothetical protein